MKKLWCLALISGVLWACSGATSGNNESDSAKDRVDSVNKKAWDSANTELKIHKDRIREKLVEKDSL